MKRSVLFLSVAVIMMLCVSAFAQTVSNGDTLEVGPLNSEGQPLGALNEAIHGDTTATGERAHTVYKLQRNAQYILTETIQADFPLVIVAPAPDDANRPPIIRNGLKADGAAVSEWWHLFDNATFKNLWMTGINLDGTGPTSWITQVVNAQKKTIAYESCILEAPYTWWAMFADWGSHNTYTTKDCIFMNVGNPSGTTWNGAIFNGGTIAKIHHQNTTFYKFGAFAANGSVYEQVIDHCTFINSVVHPVNSHDQILRSYTNNIFVNCHAFSDDAAEISRHYDQEVKGLMNYAEIQHDPQELDSLYGPGGAFGYNYDPDGDGTLIPEETTWDLKNNCWYYTTAIEDYWDTWAAASPPVFANPWMNDYNTAMFENADAEGEWTWTITRIDTLGNPTGNDTTVTHLPFEYFVEENTWNVDPGIADMKNTDVLLAQNCDEIRRGWAGEEIANPVKWHGMDSYLAFDWPLDFDLSYSNATLQSGGTDGYALGDLNWFPAQKAAWEAENPVDRIANASDQFELQANYPNPFNPTTTISYNVKAAGNVELAVYNILGEKVKTLVSAKVAAGRHNVTWNATNDMGLQVATGVYFYKLEMGGQVQVRKMLLVK